MEEEVDDSGGGEEQMAGLAWRVCCVENNTALSQP